MREAMFAHARTKEVSRAGSGVGVWVGTPVPANPAVGGEYKGVAISSKTSSVGVTAAVRGLYDDERWKVGKRQGLFAVRKAGTVMRSFLLMALFASRRSPRPSSKPLPHLICRGAFHAALAFSTLLARNAQCPIQSCESTNYSLLPFEKVSNHQLSARR